MWNLADIINNWYKVTNKNNLPHDKHNDKKDSTAKQFRPLIIVVD